MIDSSDLKHDYRKNNQIPIRIHMLSKDSCCLGISYDACNVCDGITHDKPAVVNKYHSIKFGFIFVTITFTWW